MQCLSRFQFNFASFFSLTLTAAMLLQNTHTHFFKYFLFIISFSIGGWIFGVAAGVAASAFTDRHCRLFLLPFAFYLLVSTRRLDDFCCILHPFAIFYSFCLLSAQKKILRWGRKSSTVFILFYFFFFVAISRYQHYLY